MKIVRLLGFCCFAVLGTYLLGMACLQVSYIVSHWQEFASLSQGFVVYSVIDLWPRFLFVALFVYAICIVNRMVKESLLRDEEKTKE